MVFLFVKNTPLKIKIYFHFLNLLNGFVRLRFDLTVKAKL